MCCVKSTALPEYLAMCPFSSEVDQTREGTSAFKSTDVHRRSLSPCDIVCSLVGVVSRRCTSGVSGRLTLVAVKTLLLVPNSCDSDKQHYPTLFTDGRWFTHRGELATRAGVCAPGWLIIYVHCRMFCSLPVVLSSGSGAMDDD